MFHDFRYGLRIILKNPGFALVAVSALALGIGANTAIFTIVDAVLLRPAAFRDPARLMLVWEKPPREDRYMASPSDFTDWRDQNQVFDQMGARSGITFNLSGFDQPEQIPGARVSANFFDVLGVRPARGRGFRPDEEQPGAQPVVLINDTLWKRRFGADPNILNQPITINEQKYLVIGVLPPQFRFLASEIWTPLIFKPEEIGRDFHQLLILARLKPEVTLERARSDMAAIARRIARDYPKSNQGWSATVQPIREWLIGSQLQQTLIILLGAVGLVLLIACVNVANLLLARSASRQKEMALRAALGAGRGRIARQLLSESLLLSGAGGLLGLLLALWFVAASATILPPSSLPAATTLSIDLRVLLFTLGASLLTGVLFGLVPAWQASRTDLIESLKEGARGSSGSAGSRRFRIALVMSEVALSAVLLVGAGLLMKSLLFLQEVEPGFRSEHVLTMQLSLTRSRYPKPALIPVFYRSVLARIHELNGVRSAAIATGLPLKGRALLMQFEVDGFPPVAYTERPIAHFQIVSPEYFAAMSIPLVKGRVFDDHDREQSQLVAIVNENFARRFLANEDPVGRRIRTDSLIAGQNALGPIVTREIVGVTGNVKVTSLGEDTEPEIYVPYPQNPWPGAFVIVRSSGDPLLLANQVRGAIQTVDKDQPVANVKAMEQIEAESTSQPRFRVILLGGFAGLALLLAAVGIYGVISYSVAQRRQEIGIRLALGAKTSEVVALVVRQGMLMAGLGVLIGIAASIGFAQALERFLFGVKPGDPLTLVAVSLMLLLVAFAASYIPARRATRIDPIDVLRAQ